MTTFRFVPAKGQSPHAVQVSGEWNNWASPGVALAADGSGGFQVEVALSPGLIAYKLIVDGTWQLVDATLNATKDVFASYTKPAFVSQVSSNSLPAVRVMPSPKYAGLSRSS